MLHTAARLRDGLKRAAYSGHDLAAYGIVSWSDEAYGTPAWPAMGHLGKVAEMAGCSCPEWRCPLGVFIGNALRRISVAMCQVEANVL